MTNMRSIVLAAFLIALITLALADSYPISGRWGESAGSDKGAINCSGKRVIDFNGNERTDSNGGVPAYRNKSVTPEGTSSYRVVDVFSNGQVNNAQTSYTLRLVDPDHIEMSGQAGSLKLQRCE